MVDNQEIKSRAENIRRERRRKPGQMAYGGGRLSVDEEALDRVNFEYRFVNDTPGRVKRLHDADWDRVNDPDVKPDATAQGTVVSVHGGTEASGQPFEQVLMRKHKDWYKSDQQEKLKAAEEVDKQLSGNMAEKIAATTDKDLANNAYVPGSGNSINAIRGAKKSP